MSLTDSAPDLDPQVGMDFGPGPNGPEPTTLVIACGALARELTSVLRASGFEHFAITCLPAVLHNRPDRIAPAVRDRIQANRARYPRILCLYGDCGTGGLLDQMLAEEGAERIDGAHCYDMFAGPAAFAAIMDEEPGTFFLTDYLARHFDRLVIQGLGLDRFPDLRDQYFGRYKRLIYLAQTHDPDLEMRAVAASCQLNLTYERRFVGLGAVGEFFAERRGRG